ncbi:MAG: DNA polymerase ligase N-terminal domain-containing protein [Planctomycetaceae bacterium]
MAGKSMPRRFVILEHDHPFLHWDLLLEEECSARTWRLLRKPCLGEPIAAEPLPDHRLMYLDYEGVVSGDRGSVKRILAGTYDVADQTGVLVVALWDNVLAKSALIRTLIDGRVFVSFA